MSLSKSLIKSLSTSGRSNPLSSFLILLVSDLQCHSGMSRPRIQSSSSVRSAGRVWVATCEGWCYSRGILALGGGEKSSKVLSNLYRYDSLACAGLWSLLTPKRAPKVRNGFPLAVNQACTLTDACTMVLVTSYPGSWETWVKSHLFPGGLGQVSHLSPVNFFPPL